MEINVERFKAKQIAREYFQKNIDNISTGTEGLPDTSSFIYGFMEGYLCAKEEDKEKIEKLKKVLSFYAKPSVWGTDTPCMETSIDPCDQEYLDAYGTRGGKLARQILKEIE